MEKEFFENALKQKRYQNNMISKTDDINKGQQSSPPSTANPDAVSNKNEINQESNESP